MKAYDLFAGAGGASLGLTAAGYDVTGFEFWETAVETQLANGLNCLRADVNDVDWGMMLTPDLLWASPPCQPYSKAGKMQGSNDERDGMTGFIRAVLTLLPGSFVMENVATLSSPRYETHLNAVLDALRPQYQLEWKVLNCANFGVPQTRKRFVLIGRLGQDVIWPEGNCEWVSMAEATGVPPEWQLELRQGVTRPSGRVPAPLIGCDRPAPALTTQSVGASQWRFLQDGEPQRLVTEAEALAFQGFPEDFKVSGTSKRVRGRQVGNAVPPALAQELALVLS